MNDTRMHFHLKTDSEGEKAYWFNFASDCENRFNQVLAASKSYGSCIGRLVMEPSSFHRGNGYRKYMLWAILPDSMEAYSFLIAIACRGCGRCAETVVIGFDNDGWPVCDKCAPVLEENHIAVTRFA